MALVYQLSALTILMKCNQVMQGSRTYEHLRYERGYSTVHVLHTVHYMYMCQCNAYLKETYVQKQYVTCL